jgi:hypothetical protein
VTSVAPPTQSKSEKRKQTWNIFRNTCTHICMKNEKIGKTISDRILHKIIFWVCSWNQVTTEKNVARNFCEHENRCHQNKAIGLWDVSGRWGGEGAYLSGNSGMWVGNDPIGCFSIHCQLQYSSTHIFIHPDGSNCSVYRNVGKYSCLPPTLESRSKAFDCVPLVLKNGPREELLEEKIRRRRQLNFLCAQNLK